MALNYDFPNFNISRDRFINDDDGTQTFNELQAFVEKIKDFHRESVKRLVYGESFILKVSSNTGTPITAGVSPVILADATSQEITVNLPKASDSSGLVYFIKKVDTSVNKVVVDGNGSETIDGDTTFDLVDSYEAVTVVSDGSNWFVL